MANSLSKSAVAKIFELIRTLDTSVSAPSEARLPLDQPLNLAMWERIVYLCRNPKNSTPHTAMTIPNVVGGGHGWWYCHSLGLLWLVSQQRVINTIVFTQ